MFGGLKGGLGEGGARGDGGEGATGGHCGLLFGDYTILDNHCSNAVLTVLDSIDNVVMLEYVV